MTLKVYCTHWSDNNEKWGKPNWTTQRLSTLNLPFGYFLARDDKHAEDIVKTLPALTEIMMSSTKKPFGLYLGSFPHTEIVYRPEE